MALDLAGQSQSEPDLEEVLKQGRRIHTGQQVFATGINDRSAELLINPGDIDLEAELITFVSQPEVAEEFGPNSGVLTLAELAELLLQQIRDLT